MFGDVGHGLLILIFSLYFVFNEKKFNAMGDAVRLQHLEPSFVVKQT